MHFPRQALALFTALVLTGVSSEASDIRLTEDGKSQYTIVLSEEASL